MTFFSKSNNEDEHYERKFDLIKILRVETENVKQCFTNQTHQTMMLCSGVLSLFLAFLHNFNNNGVAWLLATICLSFFTLLISSTSHVGTHKFTTANRLAGYEIYLSRLSEYGKIYQNKKSLIQMLHMDWEEALFAWRIVQPVIFDFIYQENSKTGETKERIDIDDSFTPEQMEKIKDYKWYDSRHLVEKVEIKNKSENGSPLWGKYLPTPSFHPGKYLRKKLSQLFFFNYIILALQLFCCIYIVGLFISKIINGLEIKELLNTGSILLPVYFSMAIALWSKNLRYFNKHKKANLARCNILESGLLSIQSCAMVWRLVIIVHLLAKLRCEKEATGLPFMNFTKNMSEIACNELAINLHSIHNWVKDKETEIEGILSSK